MESSRISQSESSTVPDAVPGAGQGARSAVPGRGGISRIAGAARNSIRGIAEGATSEAAIVQELALLAVAVPLSFYLAESAWVWVALMVSLFLVLAVEFLNTAIERLCDHVTPQRHEDIRVAKDLASAGVTFSLAIAALVWGVAALMRFGVLS